MIKQPTIDKEVTAMLYASLLVRVKGERRRWVCTRGQTQGLARVMEKWPTVTGRKSSSLGYMSSGERV